MTPDAKAAIAIALALTVPAPTPPTPTPVVETRVEYRYVMPPQTYYQPQQAPVYYQGPAYRPFAFSPSFGGDCVGRG